MMISSVEHTYGPRPPFDNMFNTERAVRKPRTMNETRDLRLFVAAAKHGGFRGAARATSTPASTVSEAVKRLEDRLGVRLLNRTSRSVALTAAGAALLDRIVPALDGLDSALDAAAGFGKGPRGVLRLNVPGAVTRTILPPVVEGFLAAYPDVTLDLIVNDGLVDILAEGADAGIRYGETLAQDVIAVPIGPRVQRFATAAAPAYLAVRRAPDHPRDLLSHACIRTRFPSGALAMWEFERDGEVLTLDPDGSLTVSTQAAELATSAAIAGLGIIGSFEEWLRPALDDGRLLPVLEPWWPTFEGPFLYYSSRRHIPPPLRAFVDFVKAGAKESVAQRTINPDQRYPCPNHSAREDFCDSETVVCCIPFQTTWKGLETVVRQPSVLMSAAGILRASGW